MHTDLMIDLETLGTGPNAAITQIGLAAFNKLEPDAEILVVTHHLEVQPQMRLGAEMDYPAIQWWLTQNEEARRAMTDVKRVFPTEALFAIDLWLTAHVDPKATHWSNSPSFDHVILRSLYNRTTWGSDCPFHYRQEADVRTLRLLFPSVPKVVPTVAHQAGYDAKAQALYVQDVYEHIRNTTKE